MIAPVGTAGAAPLQPPLTRPRGAFSIEAHSAAEVQDAGRPAPPPSVAGTALLGLQEAGERPERERREAARRRAQAMLAQLGAIQRALLAGTEDAAALALLRHLVAAHGAAAAGASPSADPALDAIASQIVLRARIELARRESGPEPFRR